MDDLSPQLRPLLRDYGFIRKGARRDIRNARCSQSILRRRTAFENNQEAVLLLAGNLEGYDPDADRFALSILFRTHVLPYGFKAFLPRFFDRASQLKQQPGPRHL